MGRHAAPGEDEPEVQTALRVAIPSAETAESLRAPGSRPLPTPRGRHAVPDEDEEPETAIDGDAAKLPGYEADSIAVTDRLPRPAPADEVAERPPAQRPAKKEGATAADLRLLRSDSALRNRVLAAAVVPFVLFFVVLEIIGRLGAFAVWVWLPLITAGIGGGVLLDSAHAKAKAAPPPGE